MLDCFLGGTVIAAATQHKRIRAFFSKELESGKKDIEKDLAKMVRYCQVIRVIAHTQVKISF